MHLDLLKQCPRRKFNAFYQNDTPFIVTTLEFLATVILKVKSETRRMKKG
jgi:hypothetical protein